LMKCRGSDLSVNLPVNEERTRFDSDGTHQVNHARTGPGLGLD